jgi:hypothetical protein
MQTYIIYSPICVFTQVADFACKFHFRDLHPRVEAGKNISTVIPASRKRRPKGNPVVSGETMPADQKKVNEDLFLDKPLHVIQNHSKLAYRI